MLLIHKQTRQDLDLQVRFFICALFREVFHSNFVENFVLRNHVGAPPQGTNMGGYKVIETSVIEFYYWNEKLLLAVWFIFELGAIAKCLTLGIQHWRPQRNKVHTFPWGQSLKCLLHSFKILRCIRVHGTVLTFTSKVATPFVSLCFGIFITQEASWAIIRHIAYITGILNVASFGVQHWIARDMRMSKRRWWHDTDWKKIVR